MRLMDVIRDRLGGAHRAAPTMTLEQRRLQAEQQRLADRLRLMRVDAGIPDRRHRFVAVHPHRRKTDQA